jgi:histidine triad (HIT) family protein
MPDCIFCKIAAHQIPSRIVHEDDEVVAFEDVHPQAPVHILVIPKRHVARLSDLTEKDGALAERLVTTASRIAADRGIAERGYRVVINCNAEGGQTVDHLHLHLLGGRQMTWPPG